MILVVEAAHTYIVDAPPAAVTAVRAATSAMQDGYQFSRQYKLGVWDGRVHLCKRNIFPTGLLAHVRHALDGRFQYTVVDKRRPLLAASTGRAVAGVLGSTQLRDYQKLAAKALLCRPNGIVKMATNAGKTHVYASVIRTLGPKIPSVVVVHSVDLLYQTAAVLRQLTGYAVGVVGDGKLELGKPITILSVDTLRSKFDILIKAIPTATLIVDECHHVAAAATAAMLMKFPKSPFHRRYGASGTPLRYDVLSDMITIGALGPVVYEVTNAQLVAGGYSAQPCIVMHPCIQPDIPFTSDMDYDEAYRACIVSNTARNTRIANLAMQMFDNGPILIAVNWVQHAMNIAACLAAVGCSHYKVITGQTSSAEREAVLDAMRQGQHMIVVATVFQEGVDVPNLCGLILAFGGSGGSHIKLLQAIGRVMRRKSSGNNVVTVHDFIDLGNPYLESHSIQRRDLYEAEKFSILKLYD